MILAILSFIRATALFLAFFGASFLPQPTYIEGVVGQPTGFNPVYVGNDVDRSINKIIYRSLFTYDDDSQITPDLAEVAEMSTDGLTYTVRIKANERWQDGKLITANDILYTVSSYKKLSGIAVDILDNRTVRFTLPNKFSPFLDLLTVSLLPNHKSENFNPWLPIGSGDYRVVRVNKDRGFISSVVLEGNSPSLGVTRVIFKFYESDADLEMAAKLGEINGFYSKSADFSYKNFTKHTETIKNRYYALFFNTRRDSLKNIDSRAFLTSALDTPSILDSSLNGDYVLATGPLSLNKFSRGDLSYALVSNPKTLKKLTMLDLVIAKNDTNQALALEIKNAWQKVGVIVTIKSYDTDYLTNQILPSRDFDVLLFGQEVGFDADRYVLWHTTQSNYPGLNLSGISNNRIDVALEEGRKTSDPEERLRHYGIFQKAVMDEVPAVFLYHPIVNYYLRSNLINVNLNNFALPEDRFKSLSDWAFN